MIKCFYKSVRFFHFAMQYLLESLYLLLMVELRLLNPKGNNVWLRHNSFLLRRCESLTTGLGDMYAVSAEHVPQ